MANLYGYGASRDTTLNTSMNQNNNNHNNNGKNSGAATSTTAPLVAIPTEPPPALARNSSFPRLYTSPLEPIIEGREFGQSKVTPSIHDGATFGTVPDITIINPGVRPFRDGWGTVLREQRDRDIGRRNTVPSTPLATARGAFFLQGRTTPNSNSTSCSSSPSVSPTFAFFNRASGQEIKRPASLPPNPRGGRFPLLPLTAPVYPHNPRLPPRRGPTLQERRGSLPLSLQQIPFHVAGRDELGLTGRTRTLSDDDSDSDSDYMIPSPSLSPLWPGTPKSFDEDDPFAVDPFVAVPPAAYKPHRYPVPRKEDYMVPRRYTHPEHLEMHLYLMRQAREMVAESALVAAPTWRSTGTQTDPIAVCTSCSAPCDCEGTVKG